MAQEFEDGRVRRTVTRHGRSRGERGPVGVIDFKLSEGAIQSSFDVDKYQCLAFDWPERATRFRERVEELWPLWVEEVSKAPWRRNFSRSVLASDNAGIARALYVSAVWGFGVEGWVPRCTTGGQSGGDPLGCIIRLQEISKPNMARVNLWDTPIFLGTGMYIPCEFGTLDRFLDSVWSSL